MNGAYPIKYFLLRLLKFHSNDHILNEDEKVVQKEITDFIKSEYSALAVKKTLVVNIKFSKKQKFSVIFIDRTVVYYSLLYQCFSTLVSLLNLLRSFLKKNFFFLFHT